MTNRWGKKYTYYHCYRKERRYRFCPEPAVEATVVEQSLQRFFDDLTLPPEWTAALVERLDKLVAGGLQLEDRTRRLQEEHLARTRARKQRLRELLVDELISPSDYKEDAARLERQEQDTQATLESGQNAGRYLQPWKDAAILLKQAPLLLQAATPEEKRALVLTTTFNLTIRDKLLLIEAKKIFGIYRGWRDSPTVRAWLDTVETAVLDSLNSSKEEAVRPPSDDRRDRPQCP